jgi:HlyD family secretion protein
LSTVKRGDLSVSIHTIGLLDAAKSHMVSSEIRGNKGKIIALVRDGSWVEKDAELVRLDPSPFEEEVHRLQGKVESLEAAVESVRQLVSWEENQAAQKIAAREYDLKVAELDLERLVNGEGPLQLAQYREEMEKARAEQDRYSSFFRELKKLEKEGFKNPAEVSRARQNAATYKDKYEAARRRFTSYRDFVLPSLQEAAKAKVQNSRLILEQTRKAAVFKVANVTADLAQARAKTATVRSSLALARRELEKSVIRAPFAGIAILYKAFRDGQKRKPRVGDTVLMNQPILYLPDIKKFIVRTQVREVDLYKVKIGQQAAVRIDAYPALTFTAEVQSIGALAAEEQPGQGGGKYFQLILTLNGQDLRLRPGMTARVLIKAESAQNVLLLPVQAVFRDNDGKTFCYRTTALGLQKVAVSIGRDNDLQVEIISGLDQGDQVSLVPPDSAKTNR